MNRYVDRNINKDTLFDIETDTYVNAETETIYILHKQTREQKLHRRHKQMHDSEDIRGLHKRIRKL